jgi:hypothetical protein
MEEGESRHKGSSAWVNWLGFELSIFSHGNHNGGGGQGEIWRPHEEEAGLQDHAIHTR